MTLRACYYFPISTLKCMHFFVDFSGDGLKRLISVYRLIAVMLISTRIRLPSFAGHGRNSGAYHACNARHLRDNFLSLFPSYVPLNSRPTYHWIPVLRTIVFPSYGPLDASPTYHVIKEEEDMLACRTGTIGLLVVSNANCRAEYYKTIFRSIS